ncbi:unnamed protein product [Spirodela intermedia]|uniref:Uncharacterized protein n=1 Tax=Spirodela intermedia TaxID=51605 RepID=A0A7I8L8T9_SPIIN|nr:unnamed protein product [Spirodela intermedia]
MYSNRHLREQQQQKKLRRFYDQELEQQQEEEQEKEEEKGEGEEAPLLLPGLPDDIAQLCLTRLPPRVLFAVCRSWRRLLYSPSFPPFLSLYALLSCASSPAAVELQTFDPVAAAWRPVPHHPQFRHLLLSHPGFLSRSLPVQSVAAAGRLVFLAATTHSLLPALPRPLVFHPGTSQWHLAPPLRSPRRWCAAGTAGGRIYVVSGVGHGYCADVARSVERWDPASSDGVCHWEQMAPLRDGRFSREAVDAVASSGKLCIVNVRGRASKEGAVYDIAADRWEDMPRGLLAGWTGPVAAAEDDDDQPGSPGGTIYVADEAEGVLKAYDWFHDRWIPVARSELLREAVHVTAGGGRVCVACSGGKALVVVDVSSRPARMWAVDLPPGKKVVGLHVLPRPSRGDLGKA